MRHEVFARRSTSLAAAVSLILCSAQVAAQDKALEEIIVTGSFIEGTPEDTALPVEVITQEELDNLGRPSNLDLVKMMSEVGQVAGEAYRSNAYPIGAATVNLRNIGARFTTVVFNGRRFPEQYSVATGRFNNVAWIPNAAVGRIEVLKEGGAATYGADAVGGVVNYITRRDLDGFEVNADYRYIADSDGDYNADLQWGTTFDRGNFMVIGGYQHRSILRTTDREWTQTSYLENKTLLHWSANGSPGSFGFQRPVTGVQTGFTPTTVTNSDVQMGASGIVRDPNCAALGGFAGWSTTPSPICYLNIAQFDNLVEESDSYQFYSELNFRLTDATEFHGEALYYELDLPDIATQPGDTPANWPLLGPNYTSATRQNVANTPAYFVDGHNPGVAHFLNNLRDSDGSLAFTPAQIQEVIDGGRAYMVQNTWRPFGNGGNPLFGESDSQHNNTKMYRLTAELKGDLPDFWGAHDWGWDLAATYSRVDYKVETRDMLVNRLQDSLNGFGGANCNGVRADLAGSTCQWFNPFSSAIQRNAYTGQVNPGFVSSLQNNPDMIRWLYVPIWLDRAYEYVFLDAVANAKTRFELPGGPIAFAVGAQYRYSAEEFNIDDLSNRDINGCPTVGVTGCTNVGSPLVFGRNTSVLGTTSEPGKRKYPVIAGFVEAQLPLHDTVNLQVAGRFEKFYSDVTDNDNEIFVPAAAIKWQPLDWFAIRTSAGRTFSQVNPPEDDGPEITTAGVNNLFGGITGYEQANYDNVDIKPEKGSYLDVGFLFQAGNFSASVDYFDIRVDDYTRTMAVNNVITALLAPGQGTGNINALLNCSSPLFNGVSTLGGRPFVQLSSPCVPGTSTLANSLQAGSRINYFGGTGQTNSGELKTTGIDFTTSYLFENVLGGQLRPSIDLTYNLAWELADFVVFGVPVAEGYDGLGFKNSSTGRLNQAVPEYRGSFGLNYSHGRHTLNLLVTYIPSVESENEADFDASSDQNANIGNASGVSTTGTGAATACTDPSTNIVTTIGNVPAGAGAGQYGAGSIGTNGAPLAGPRGFCGNQNVSIWSGRTVASTTNVDLTYRLELPAETTLSFSVFNLLDEEPSFDRVTPAYNAGFGSPLERNYKMSVRKRF
jgi:iron complex outermembrane recepter protein